VSLRERVQTLARRHGLELIGIAAADPLPDAAVRMEEAVAAGRMARMEWMGGDRPAIATDPSRHLPGARSVLVVAAPYAGSDRAAWDRGAGELPEPLQAAVDGAPAEPAGLIARYALGADYHLALRDRLSALAEDLRREGLPAGEVAFVDDRPLAERALAARAGLGWIGKNSNLLTHRRAGSWVFLGALLSTAELPPDEPLRTNCGSCRRCIDGCPTGAIVAPYTIDANRCISYLTIEHPGPLDARSASAIGQWIFGCDVCQEVCPVNAEADDSGPLRVPLLPLGEILLEMSARGFARAFARSAINRVGRHRLLRNVLVVLANTVDPAASSPAQLDAARSLAERAQVDRRAEVRDAARRLSPAVGR
jgi:epoxyqueuosine reductase